MLPYSTPISNPNHKTLILIPSQVANGSQVANEGDEESAAYESAAEPLLAPLHVTSENDDDNDDDDSYTPTDDDDNDSYDDEKEPRRWCPELETARKDTIAGGKRLKGRPEKTQMQARKDLQAG